MVKKTISKTKQKKTAYFSLLSRLKTSSKIKRNKNTTKGPQISEHQTLKPSKNNTTYRRHNNNNNNNKKSRRREGKNVHTLARLSIEESH
jgi:hypothetical protein